MLHRLPQVVEDARQLTARYSAHKEQKTSIREPRGNRGCIESVWPAYGGMSLTDAKMALAMASTVSTR